MSVPPAADFRPPTRLQRQQEKLPSLLAYRAPLALRSALFWPFYHYCVPARQDAPILVYTMGKVGTVSLEKALWAAGCHFVHTAHRLRGRAPDYPLYSPETRAWVRHQRTLARIGLRWLVHLPRLRVVTVVREPIARMVSLYLFAYPWLFGETTAAASLETLLERFPRIFDAEYGHPLVPGEFFATEIAGHLGIDLYAHPFDAHAGWSVIEHENVSLLLLRAETPDAVKERACADWLGRPLGITQKNRAEDVGYADRYAEFKRRVRIPRRFAEILYDSRFLHHFYTAEERLRFRRRWEPQLDDTLALPAWFEASLLQYHPPLEPGPARETAPCPPPASGAGARPAARA